MLYSYLKIAYRSLLKNSTFSFINIVGLSLGIAAFTLILEYISFESSVNQFHKNLPQLYRTLFETKKGEIWDYSPPILATTAKQQFPEVKAYCRIAENVGNGIVSYQEKESVKSFKEDNIALADGTFFEMFTFKIRDGSTNRLAESNTAAISQTIAQKYFGDQNPLGKVLSVNNEFGKNLFEISAVFDDFPDNSDLQYSIILSLETLANPANLHGSDWARLDGSSSYLTTYFQLEAYTNVVELETKINEYKQKVQPEDENRIRLQPFRELHLASSLQDYMPHNGNLGFIYLLAAISILILVIAWLNYTNLSTAGALKRAKEVGVRKVVGASQRQLIVQFLGESLILNVLGVVLAILLVNMLQPLFNQLLHKPLSLAILFQNNILAYGILLVLVGSVASGGYTAFALSSFRPAQTLKGVFSKSTRGVWLRKGLVVFQFSISVMLIASTLILFKQLSFMRNENLGMNISQLLVIRGAQIGSDSTFQQRKEAFKNELTQTPFVEKYCGSSSVPTEGYNYSTSGITRLTPDPGDEKLGYSIAIIDHQFFPTYEISFVAGTNFTLEDCQKKFSERSSVVLNERAASQLGFSSPEDAVAKKINWNGGLYEVLGVVSDYHHMSLRQSITPTIFTPQLSSGLYTLKIQPGKIDEQLRYLEGIYQQYFPGNPFDFFFSDDNYQRQYQTEQQYGSLFSIASLLAILIACLGLFGLTTFTVEQRTKEIGIRKVMGASISQITGLLSRDFLSLVTISFFVAIPVVWWAMDRWLQEFAYRTELSAWIFLVAGVLTILLSLITIMSQTVAAAMSNPVNSLRSE
jgi:putative ABC transport system permease protein